MTEPVQGYLSKDGTFFVLKCASEQHDAEMQIRAYCVTHKVDAEKLLVHVEALAEPIKDYLNATAKVKTYTEVEAATSVDQAYKEEPAQSTPVLEQSASGHEPVSDLGSSTQSKGVLKQQSGNGSRSRRDHA